MPMINDYYYKSILTNNKTGTQYGVSKDNTLHKITFTTESQYNLMLLHTVKSKYNAVTNTLITRICRLSTNNGIVFSYIFNHRNVPDNTLYTTQKDLANKLHLPLRTTKYRLKALKDINLIKTAQDRIYINPCLAKGKSTHRAKLLKSYLHKPMDTRHKIVHNRYMFNKKQLNNIVHKILTAKMREYHIGKSSKKNAWMRMIRRAISYSNNHYCQYSYINYQIISESRKEYRRNNKHRNK